MKKFHPATWVVLKLQCSASLGLLVLPSYEHQRSRGSLAVPAGHFNIPSLRTLEFPLSSDPDWPHKYASPTALRHSSNNNKNDSRKRNRLQRLKSSVSSWSPVKTVLNGGKSVVGLFRFNKQKTRTKEAAFDQPSALVEEKATKEIVGSDESAAATATTTSGDMGDLPTGPRWAIAHPTTDLTGTWKPVINPDFLDRYDKYLTNCGTNYMFRQVCLKFCRTTREAVDQEEDGRRLHLTGKSPAGGWKRTLISSGADTSSEEYEAAYAEFLDPDKERVKVEAWWEEEGRVHRSVLREKAGVKGGTFETLRYLDPDDEKILMTDSTFHPSPDHLDDASSKFKPAFIRWKYTKE